MTAHAQYSDEAVRNWTAYQAGLNYLDGRNGVTKDIRQAANAFRQALQSQAQRYSWTLWSSRPCGHSEWYSFKPWSKLNEGDVTPAGLYQQGVWHMQGYGGKKDRDKALSSFLDSAKAGHGLAQLEASHYLLGQDDAAAYRLRQEASAQGNVAATYFLGLAFEQGGFGVEKDEMVAVQWYLKAFAQIAEHKACFERQLDSGDTRAAFYLAQILRSGLSAPYDYEGDKAYLQTAADGGMGEAQFMLADILMSEANARNGLSGENKRALSIEAICGTAAVLYDKARQQGIGYAARGRALLMAVCEEGNSAKQIALFIEGIENSTPIYSGLFDLAGLYDRQQNYGEAYKWYRIQADIVPSWGLPRDLMRQAEQKLSPAQKALIDQEVQRWLDTHPHYTP